MRTLRYSLFSLLLVLSAARTAAQCADGETYVTIVAYSYDVWAEESYWELAPAGNGCGNGTYVSGGSAEVGCAGAGPTGENGIPDYGSEALSVCIPTGALVDLIFVDWYGDGGLAFEVYQDGILTGSYWGGGLGNTWTFEAGYNPLPSYDSPCGAPQVTPDGGSVVVNTSGCVAAFSEPEPLGLSCGAYGMWCEGNATQTAWIYFIAEEGVSYEISACNALTNFDTQIAVWHGDCSQPWALELVTANDDAITGCGGGNGYASTCFASCLVPGDAYYIMVDGWAGQTGNAEVTVTTYTGPLTFQTQLNDISCPLESGQAANGSIWPYIIGTGADFACAWTGPNGFESDEHFLFDLGPGIYELTATTNCGEVFTETYEIFLPEPWDVSVSTTDTDCPQSASGTITVDAAGATPGYTYYFDGPISADGNSNPFTGAIMGNYVVTVTDSRGCNWQQQVYIDAEDDLAIDLGPDSTLCLGESMFVFAPPGLEYLWNDGSSDQFYEVVADEWGIGTHAIILTANTTDGCSDTDVLIVTVESCISVEESTAGSWTLYPNPSSDQVWLTSLQATTGVRYSIVDSMGRTVAHGTTQADRTLIDVSAFSPGIYLLHLHEKVPTVVRFAHQ